MLNFCIKVKGGRIRGHNKTIFVQMWNSAMDMYEDELSFSSMGQAISALKLNNAVTIEELMMLRDVAREAVDSISDIFVRVKK